MKELKLDNTDFESDTILLKDDDGNEFSVGLGEILKKTRNVKSGKPKQQTKPIVEINRTNPLTFGEIQSLVRAGMSEEEISSKYKADLEMVLKTTKIIHNEKRHVLSSFHNLPARSEFKGKRLIDVVNLFFDKNEIDRASVDWKATKVGNEPWKIIASFIYNDKDVEGIWLWNPKRNELSESNDVAKLLTSYYKDLNVEQGFISLKAEITGSSSYLLQPASGLKYKEVPNISKDIDNSLNNIKSTIEKIPVVQSTKERRIVKNVETISRRKPRPTLAETLFTPTGQVESVESDEKSENTSEIENLNTTARLKKRFRDGKGTKLVPNWNDGGAMFPLVDDE